MYDRLSLTVIFVYGRVVQSRDSLGDSPFELVCFCFCFARYSAQLRGICQNKVRIMDYNQTFKCQSYAPCAIFLNFFDEFMNK